MSTAADSRRTDLEAICRAIAERKKIDPALVKRVKERSDAIRRTANDDLSVQTLRAIRDE